MEISEYKNIFLNEESHFFYVSTHFLVKKLIRNYAKGDKLNILDAGCGTGGLLKEIGRFGNVVGIDFSGEAIKFAKKRGLKVKRASVINIPFPKNSFDVVTSIDVIYHSAIGDDVAALEEMVRVLKPNGILILRVPANKFLLSAHDAHVHTARRYTKNELMKKFRQAGLKIKFISYVHLPIFPMSLIRVLFERLSHKPSVSTIGTVNPIINSIFTAILKLEAEMLLRGEKMPFGQGVIAVAQPMK